MGPSGLGVSCRNDGSCSLIFAGVGFCLVFVGIDSSVLTVGDERLMPVAEFDFRSFIGGSPRFLVECLLSDMIAGRMIIVPLDTRPVVIVP